MRSDSSPAVRTPFCLLIGQPDGQLSRRRGPDIGVSNQISPSKNVFMCVCVWERGRDRTVPSDCWEHMCWRRPECVLKWRLMNERAECVCVQETEGSVEVYQRRTQTWAPVYLLCVRTCVCVSLYTVSFKFSSLVVPRLYGAEWHGRNSQSFIITAQFKKFHGVFFSPECVRVFTCVFYEWMK